MNLDPGGKQPKMHSTMLPDSMEQGMIFRQIDYQWRSNLLIAEDFSGKPKGMKRVLQERGLWRESLKKQCGKAKKEGQKTEQYYQARLEIDKCEKGKGCCALRLLESEPDFLNEESLLEIEVYTTCDPNGS